MPSPGSAMRAATLLGMLMLSETGAAAQGTVPSHSLQGLLNDLATKLSTVFLGISTPTSFPGAVLMGLEVSTAPLGTSTGGFTFTFNSQNGMFTRSSQTFGPAFGKRSLTIGKGKFSAGFNSLHAAYNSFAGLNLANGDLRFVQNARNADGTPFPVFYTSTKVNLTSDTYVGFATYGVTDDLDVGVAVPWVRVSLGADVGLFGFGDVDITPGGHLLVLPSTTASGLGDLAIFGKYRVWRQGEGGLAAQVELRLPTGDVNNLRGTGVTRTLMSAIWSRGGNVSPHANVGYEFWSSSIALGNSVFVRNQIDYAFGLELQPHARVTAIVDVIGRRLLGGGQSGYQQTSIGSGTAEVLVPLRQGLNVVSFAPGVKWNVAGNALLTGNVLASITNKGFRANVIPVVGLDWAW